MKTENVLKILSFISILTLAACSPDGRDILKGAYEKCQSIENGYYEHDRFIKLMSSVDTIHFDIKTYFRKSPDDPVAPFNINSHSLSNNPKYREINFIYTGNKWITYIKDDGLITPKKGRESDIWTNCVKNPLYRPYPPFGFPNSEPLPDVYALNSEDFMIKGVSEEVVNGFECYLVKTVVSERHDYSVMSGYGLINETHIDYWINKQDSVPVQLTITRDIVIDNEHLTELEKYSLRSYELNSISDDSIFTLSAVPDNVNMRESEPYPEMEPLKPGDVAPDWSFVSVDGDTISLADFRGELVILDFFYASCPPCISILPDIKKLHDKYADKGFNVVGLDHMDSPETIRDFAQRHGIEYPLLICDHETAFSYRAVEFPTTCLIGKDGKVLFYHVGSYNEMTYSNLDSVISGELNKK